jgi:predicted lipoprotein with Yx(FWY)xxD motif
MKTLISIMVALTATQVLADYGPPTPQPEQPNAALTQELKNDEGETLLTDNTGKSLYVFDLDQGKPQPACNADCAEVWPPYLVDQSEVAAIKAPLGTIARKNGKLQLTYEGRPVYTYAFDRHQADDKGDGIGDVWHYIELEEEN